MADFNERRYMNDRRRSDSADDIYRRLEEKRQQIERRRTVRRQADRDRLKEEERQAADDRGVPAPRQEDHPRSE
jgi:hypothetical protein